jgi:hypothetical protein
MGLDRCALQVMAPGLFSAFPGDMPAASSPDIVALERLLGRAELVREPASDPVSNLLDRFGCPQPQDPDDPPLGALSLLGEGGNPGAQFWLRATPVALHPDRDQLLVFGLEPHPPSRELVDTLVGAFNRHFEADGWRLEAPSVLRWYLRAPRALRVRSTPFDSVAGSSVGDALPGGEGGGTLRRLMAETEMLFHGVTDNASAKAGGVPGVNGLWLDGAGAVPSCRDPEYEEVVSDDPFVSGLARLCNVRRVSPAAADDPGSPSRLVYIDRLQRARRTGDPSAFHKALGALAALVLGAARELGPTDCLQLGAGGPYALRLDRRRMRRWWARPRSLCGRLDP